MLAHGDQTAAWLEHAVELATRRCEVASVMQYGAREHNVEAGVRERQALGELPRDLDWQLRVARQRLDRASPDQRARVGFERANAETLAC